MSKKTKLITGLGNPGSRYQKTRHNAGWLWLDHHFPNLNYEFDKYGNYSWAEQVADGCKVILIKPQTFMNNSGQSVSYAMRKFGVTESDLVIVHDEVDLEIGQFKYSCSRGDGGHNGLRSINQHLGNNKYCRLRLGVRPIEVAPSIKADKYVLGKFREEELELLKQISVKNLNLN
jgi:PTH1 family peptidyl-tRNA hydrolase